MKRRSAGVAPAALGRTAALGFWLFSGLAAPPAAEAYQSNQPASVVVGQANFTSGSPNQGDGVSAATQYWPNAVARNGTRLLIADSQNNRILIYDNTPAANGASADVVIGQPDFTHNSPNQGGGPLANTLSGPIGVYSVGSRVFIADTSNHRVLIFNSIPGANNASANVVVGQPNSYTGQANQGGSVGADTLADPRNVFSDGTRLLIADTGNHRVLIFNSIPAANNASADVVVGQPDMTSNAANNGGLNAAGLNGPFGLCLGGGRLFVADTSNHRVLIYSPVPAANGAAASLVIGQVDMAHAVFNQPSGAVSAQGLRYPNTVFYDGSRLFIADSDNFRVLVYHTLPTTDNPAADAALGQPDLTSAIGGTAANRFSYPRGLYSTSAQLAVGDNNNHRSLLFDDATATTTRTPTFTPTATRTGTRTVSSTPTSTFTRTPSHTATPSATTSASRTPSPSRTRTFTATISATLTPTPTLSGTATITPTSTATPSITVTPTVSQTLTATPTVTIFLVPAEEVIAYPSPAKGQEVWFYYRLDQPARVRIEIFNIAGEFVSALQSEQPAGYTRSRWDIGKVAPGVYLYRFRSESAGGVKVHPLRKVVVVKP